jgi:CO/xanthine dehydrogenase Mo-binding subunit
MGQGLTMVAEQIAAEAMELPYELVHTIGLDTSSSPNGNVTCASRMTYMVGNTLVDAAKQLKAEPKMAGVPIIALTGRAMKGDKEKYKKDSKFGLYRIVDGKK